jgi:hypothetical protein
MLNTKSAFGLLATAALVFSPAAAFAGQTQVNSQGSKNQAVTTGTNNLLIQNTEQGSVQDQVDVEGMMKDPQMQINQQQSGNAGAAIGDYNNLIQQTQQDNVQQQTDVDIPHLGH